MTRKRKDQTTIVSVVEEETNLIEEEETEVENYATEPQEEQIKTTGESTVRPTV